MVGVEFLAAAAEEVEEAEAWSAERNPLAADAFRAELKHVVDAVRGNPERWPRHLAGTRRHHFRWFPFSLVYRLQPDCVLVIAVVHQRRRPGYWRDRSVHP